MSSATSVPSGKCKLCELSSLSVVAFIHDITYTTYSLKIYNLWDHGDCIDTRCDTNSYTLCIMKSNFFVSFTSGTSLAPPSIKSQLCKLHHTLFSHCHRWSILTHSYLENPKKSRRQIMQTHIRCHILWHLIRVCIVC